MLGLLQDAHALGQLWLQGLLQNSLDAGYTVLAVLPRQGKLQSQLFQFIHANLIGFQTLYSLLYVSQPSVAIRIRALFFDAMFLRSAGQKSA